MLNLLLSCNLPDEEIERVLDLSKECTRIFSDNNIKKIIQTLSSFLTNTFKIDDKEEDLSMKRQVVVVKILKAKKEEPEGEYTFANNDCYPQSSEDESGNNLLNLEDIVSQDKNDTKNPREEIIEKKVVKIAPKVKCDLCEKMVARRRLKVHIRRVHTDTRAPCPLCGKMIRKHAIGEHVKKHTEVLKCQDCDFSTNVKGSLLGHISRNHQQRKFECEICGKLFGTGNDLNCHRLNLHGDKKSCPSCPFQTSNVDVLQRHIISHHSSSVLFSCVFCSFETGESHELQSHLGSQHPDKDTSAVNVIGARNIVKASKPKKAQTGKSTTVYRCEYQDCDYTVRDKGSLYRHVEKKHLNILYNCDFCDHVTGLKASLKTHKLRKHPDQFKIYSCHLCSFKSQSKDLIQKHMSGPKHSM